MNGSVLLLSAMAAASLALIGYLAYRIAIPSNDPHFLDSFLVDNSSLDEDLKDILEFIPLPEVRRHIEKYMKYDPQIGETVCFINDHKRFVLWEFQQMPQLTRFMKFLRQNGLDVDGLVDELHGVWKMAPRYIRPDPGMAKGGLTVMISGIMDLIPLDELHELLRQKVRYSASFRRFIGALRSEDFHEFCEQVEKNTALHHHYFWAKESDLEITFAIELLKNFHTYLTQTLIE